MNGAEQGHFVAISRFRVVNDMAAQVREAFRTRPHLVDGASGFVRMDVLSPCENENEFWLLTEWIDELSFRTWHRGHQFRESHAGIPPGLKLDPTVTEVRTFQLIAS